MVLPGRHLVSGMLIRIDTIERGKEVANVRGVCICVDWAYSELRNVKEATRGRKRKRGYGQHDNAEGSETVWESVKIALNARLSQRRESVRLRTRNEPCALPTNPKILLNPFDIGIDLEAV